MAPASLFRLRTLVLAVASAAALMACGGGGNTVSFTPAASGGAATPTGTGTANSGGGAAATPDTVTIPAEPAGLGRADTAPIPSVVAYVDTGATNQRDNPCNVTLDTNAGARVLQGFLDIWTPSSLKVDAGVNLAAANGCPAVTPSTWSGIPGDSTDGTVKNATIHAANINYVKTVTQARTTAQASAAYMDDRRGKGYSVSDGMGPLTSAWRAGTQQTTTITAVDPNTAIAPAVNDGGNNVGVGSSGGNANLGLAVDFINGMAAGSTEPPKRFYKYARPWRWSSDVKVVPALESAKSTTPATDGGFPSGHTAEAWRDTLAMAYLVPQRYQELVARAMEMGENRILAGMHSPLDTMGGRVHATAVVAYNLSSVASYGDAAKKAAFDQAQAWLRTQTGSADFNALAAYARTPRTSDATQPDFDRFSDTAAWRKTYLQRMTYGLGTTGAAGQPATVPKSAEVLLETRLPYLSADQRRVVLKSTAIDSGFPLGNDGEGWGRLNLFDAADGYGRFDGDVAVTMDASQGGFSAFDRWRNDIYGAGKLTKLGSGNLRLSGNNGYAGGTVLVAGTLGADSATALGVGDVFVKGGTLESAVASLPLVIPGRFTQTAGTLSVVAGANGAGLLQVGGTAAIAGGNLAVRFASGATPKVGDTITVLQAASRQGRFAGVTVQGFGKLSVSYTANAVLVRLDGV
ncbi:phosphatase PAP2 family protein [uncultured Pseudacidovorax sp.]|uniref:acid phosphatase n=1 Tax=uncultured Pseudacidovorax sp. TaxID=679313 RepID=UPI0025DA94F4|nr:phosphatase PAP2 family protein [uncultured Pseudacidovorax sp.]